MRRVEKTAGRLRTFRTILNEAVVSGRRLIIVIDGKHHELSRPAEVGEDFLAHQRQGAGVVVVPFGRIDEVIFEVGPE